jgi:dihydrofolate synthase/folylpolyglutamate synthase
VAARQVFASAQWSDPVSAAGYLSGLTGYEASGVIEDPSTRRIEAITAALGSPNRRFPTIHVTGTNGKGSTSAMITSLLRGSGLRVGTYTSPHLSTVTERVALDEKPVSEERFAEALGSVAWMSQRLGVTPTWFEAVTAAAFVVFADADVDAAVVEVGMLGRWDATNIVDSSVSVITNVELDHTEFAGDSRRHVAVEKAGIIRPGTTLVLGETDPDLLPVFAARRPSEILKLGVDVAAVRRRPSPTGSLIDLITPWGEHTAVPINMLGEHQCRNAALALAAAESFLHAPIADHMVHHALAAVHVTGRTEVLLARNPVVVLDGAHNAAAARALRTTLDEHPSVLGPRILVCATSGNRQPEQFLAAFGAQDFDLVIGTEVCQPRSPSADQVVAAARRLRIAALAHSEVKAAVHQGITSAGVDGLVVIAGSLYLIAAARTAVATVVAGREPQDQ